MFLKSEFFENWSDTNYFINLTLKTSKPLNYKKDWYIDYLKDSYSSGLAVNTPSAEFMDLYNNYSRIMNSYFSSVMSYQYFQNFINQPLQNDRKLFLKGLLDVFCNLTASRIKTIQASGPYGGSKFDSWVDSNLYTDAKSINASLSSFTYYFYNQLYDSWWDYIVLSKEMTMAIRSYAGSISTGELISIKII